MAAERWPGLTFDTVVLHHGAAGRVHADHAVAALQRQAAAAGAQIIHHTAARRLTQSSAGVQVVVDAGSINADHVVVAAGAWTADLVGDLVSLPALRTTKEQPAHFVPRDPRVEWPSFIHHPGSDFRGPGIYGLASPDGVKIGEHGTGPEVHPDRRDFRLDPAATARLLDYATRWLPGVDPATAAPLTCLYTTTPDGNFIVDRVDRVTVAAGFSGHGFKFAPAIGELVAGLVGGNISAPELFSLSRNRDSVAPARSA